MGIADILKRYQKAKNIPLIIVEQNLHFARRIGDRFMIIQKGRSDGHGYGHSFIPVADDCVCSHGRCGYDLLYPYLRFGRKCDVLQLQRRDQRLHGRRYRQKQVPYVCRRFHGILYSAWCSVENWRHTERKFFGNLECSFSQSEKSCGPCASVWLLGQP